MTAPKGSSLKVVLGAMTIGREGFEGVRVHTVEQGGQMLDVFQKHGYSEVDTARLYGQGSSEEYLGKLEWQTRKLVMATKLYPTAGRDMSKYSSLVYSHSAEDVRRGLLESLRALQTDYVDLWYLHGPDRSTPIDITLREVDKLHKEGHFKRFGISNYMSWEVARICELCEANGWLKPSVYQGIYNPLHRAIEAELLPCLRNYGIALYAFQPLAGGLLTGRYQRDTTDFEAGSRFDPQKWQGNLHHQRYWNDATFDALDAISAAAKKHSLTEAECALRWMKHHSLLRDEAGDALIIGASSPPQLERNLADLEKGPLPEEVVQALDAAWPKVRGVVNRYWH